jgi:hypothetical protein
MFYKIVTHATFRGLNSVIKVAILEAAYKKEIVKYVNDIQMFSAYLKLCFSLHREINSSKVSHLPIFFNQKGCYNKFNFYKY